MRSWNSASITLNHARQTRLRKGTRKLSFSDDQRHVTSEGSDVDILPAGVASPAQALTRSLSPLEKEFLERDMASDQDASSGSLWKDPINQIRTLVSKKKKVCLMFRLSL